MFYWFHSWTSWEGEHVAVCLNKNFHRQQNLRQTTTWTNFTKHNPFKPPKIIAQSKQIKAAKLSYQQRTVDDWNPNVTKPFQSKTPGDAAYREKTKATSPANKSRGKPNLHNFDAPTYYGFNFSCRTSLTYYKLCPCHLELKINTN